MTIKADRPQGQPDSEEFSTPDASMDSAPIGEISDPVVSASDGAHFTTSGRGTAKSCAPLSGKVKDDGPRLWKAVDLQPSGQSQWLAQNRLPRGAVSLLVGDEGIGKSLFWVWIASAVTTGKPLPEFGIPARDPASVIVVATEDDWSTTVLPRLEVAGADLDRVQVICENEDGSGTTVFPRDLDLIYRAEPLPTLVVVDSWLDTVPPGRTVRDPQQARQVLHPWRELATTTNTAVLLLCHTNRASSGDPRDRYGVTGELRKKARMTLYAQADEDGRLIVGPEKTNTAAPTAASVFSITAVKHFPATAENDGAVPRLTYVGESERTSRDLLADSYDRGRGIDSRDRREAQDWLRDYLLLEGPSASSQVKRDAREAGITEKALRNARQRLKVRFRREGMPATTVWSLPDQVGHVSPQGTAQTLPQQGATGTTGDSTPVSAGQPRSVQSCPTERAGHDRASDPPSMRTQPDYGVPPAPGTGMNEGKERPTAPGGINPSDPGWTDTVKRIVANSQQSALAGRMDDL